MAIQTFDLVSWGTGGQTRIQVRIDPDLILGVSGMFGSALLINYDVTAIGPHADEAALLTIEGWLLWNNEQPVTPGIHIPSQVSGPNQMRLLVPLTPEQIEAIEQARGGDAVHFNVALAGTARLANPWVQVLTRSQRTGPTVEQLAQQVEVHTVHHQGTAQRLRIERERWLTILDGVGAGKRRLVELPVPLIPGRDEAWATCLRHLETALLHHRRGEYEQALLECRKTVEGVATVLGEVWGCPQRQGQNFELWTRELAGRLTKAWPSEREAPKMLAALLAAGWSWTSPNAHYGVDMPVREESAFGLAAATDLLMFAAQLVKAHPPTQENSAPVGAVVD